MRYIGIRGHFPKDNLFTAFAGILTERQSKFGRPADFTAFVCIYLLFYGVGWGIKVDVYILVCNLFAQLK